MIEILRPMSDPKGCEALSADGDLTHQTARSSRFDGGEPPLSVVVAVPGRTLLVSPSPPAARLGDQPTVQPEQLAAPFHDLPHGVGVAEERRQAVVQGGEGVEDPRREGLRVEAVVVTCGVRMRLPTPTSADGAAPRSLPPYLQRGRGAEVGEPLGRVDWTRRWVSPSSCLHFGSSIRVGGGRTGEQAGGRGESLSPESQGAITYDVPTRKMTSRRDGALTTTRRLGTSARFAFLWKDPSKLWKHRRVCEGRWLSDQLGDESWLWG